MVGNRNIGPVKTVFKDCCYKNTLRNSRTMPYFETNLTLKFMFWRIKTEKNIIG